MQLLSALCINFFTFMSDWEARFRTLVATGTMLTSSPEALDYARTLEAKDGARGWRILEGPTKVTIFARSFTLLDLSDLKTFHQVSECASFIEAML